MITYSVPRTGLSNLVFEGAVVARTTGRHSRSDAAKRWHNLTIYRTVTDRWVVSIAFRTSQVGEQSRDDAIMVDTWDDVIELFSRYPVTKSVGRSPTARLNATERLKLVAAVTDQYDSQVRSLLQAVTPNGYES